MPIVGWLDTTRQHLYKPKIRILIHASTTAQYKKKIFSLSFKHSKPPLCNMGYKLPDFSLSFNLNLTVYKRHTQKLKNIKLVEISS